MLYKKNVTCICVLLQEILDSVTEIDLVVNLKLEKMYSLRNVWDEGYAVNVEKVSMWPQSM